MYKTKFLNIVLFSFSFIVMTNGLAFAERDCTRQVGSSDGTKTITIDCSSSYTQTTDNFWNKYYFSTLVSNMMDSINLGIQNMQDRLAVIFSAQDHSKQVEAEMKQKEQDAMEDQQTKQQDQQSQLEDARDRQEMQKEQQQDAMQDLRDRN